MISQLADTTPATVGARTPMKIAPVSAHDTEAIVTATRSVTTPFNAQSGAEVVEGIDLSGRRCEMPQSRHIAPRTRGS